MNILATSDLHGNLNSLDLKNIDILCIAGDIAPLKSIDEYGVFEQKEWVQNVFCKLMEENKNIQFIFTPGNHDFFPIAKDRFSNKFDFEIKWPKNAHMLIDQLIEINGIKFYGTPWVPIINFKWAFELYDLDLIKRFSNIPADIDILLTHCPPYFKNYDVDKVLQYDNPTHFGCDYLTQVYLVKHPKYAFFGHIHSGSHKLIMAGDTICANVSRLNENYLVFYEPFKFKFK